MFHPGQYEKISLQPGALLAWLQPWHLALSCRLPYSPLTSTQTFLSPRCFPFFWCHLLGSVSSCFVKDRIQKWEVVWHFDQNKHNFLNFILTFICKIDIDSLKGYHYIIFIVVKLICQISYTSSCCNVLFFISPISFLKLLP